MHAIYEFVAKDQLSEILRAFNASIGLPIQLLDQDGRILQAYGPAPGYCRMLKKLTCAQGACQRVYVDAGRLAQQIGGTYIFACPAELNHIAFPMVSHESLLGVIMVGPFLLDRPDTTLVASLGDQNVLTPATLLELYEELDSVKVVLPEQAGHISRLLFHLLSPLIPQQRQLLRQSQEKLYQQSRINETIQVFKSLDPPAHNPYPYEKEIELLTKVKTGNLQEAKGVLNDLLGYVFFCEGGQMETMKNRSLELCTLLSRIAIEGGALKSSVFQLNNQFIASLQSIQTLESLCYKLQEIVEAFVDATFRAGADKSDTVRKAAAFVAQHYAEPIALDDVARHVGLSSAYFSSLFRREVGMGFRSYLNQIRVEESKRLLSSTDYALVDIAVAMGFNDQSYFTKVFKKYTGLTPTQYR